MKSILEEYKCGNVRLVTMLEDSDDPVVKTVQPSIKTGRKWKVAEATDEAKECLKMKEQTNYRTCPELIQSITFTRAIYLEAQHGASGTCLSIISGAKRQSKPPSPSFTIFTTEGGAKKWCGRSNTASTQRKRLLDGCDDWEVSADFPEWDRRPDITRRTTLRSDIVIHHLQHNSSSWWN
ncbi:polyprotein [Elysia marginata]|uniref:Polyprotein n=1 Tax=Elysia marginata TaxID=1093978 RepID=A0AAV4J3H1_9GAST|nr:polyprotein [Elysia marginata]